MVAIAVVVHCRLVIIKGSLLLDLELSNDHEIMLVWNGLCFALPVLGVRGL